MRKEGLRDPVSTATLEAKINDSYAVIGATPKTSESYQRPAAVNSSARRHVRTNSHHHVKGILTAVTHRARHDGKYGYPHMLICDNKVASSLPSGDDNIFITQRLHEIAVV